MAGMILTDDARESLNANIEGRKRATRRVAALIDAEIEKAEEEMQLPATREEFLYRSATLHALHSMRGQAQFI